MFRNRSRTNNTNISSSDRSGNNRATGTAGNVPQGDMFDTLLSKSYDFVRATSSTMRTEIETPIAMLAAHINGHRELTNRTKLAIAMALFYVISPIDLIPDAIPLVGYLDDLWVLRYFTTFFSSEISRFNSWRTAHPELDVYKPANAECLTARIGSSMKREVMAVCPTCTIS